MFLYVSISLGTAGYYGSYSQVLIPGMCFSWLVYPRL